MMHSLLLNILIWLPLAGGAFVLLAGNDRPAIARWMALLVSLLVFAFSIELYLSFDASLAEMQFIVFNLGSTRFTLSII